MTVYIIRRFFQSLLFIWLATLVVYTVVVVIMPLGPRARYEQLLEEYNRLAQSDPNSFPARETLLDIKRAEEAYELDKPWPANYLAWLFDPTETTQLNNNFEEIPKGIRFEFLGMRITGAGILTGDFGRSRSAAVNVPVGELIADKAGNTLLLVGVSLLLSFLVAIPVGMIGAVSPRSWFSHALTFLSLGGRSLPPFALGLVLILLLAVIPYQLHVNGGITWLPYLPVSEPADMGQEANWANRIYHLVLPVLTLSSIQIVWIARYVRSTMLEVLPQDYIRTARAKGLSTRQVIYKHALRNAMLPLITLLGLTLPGLISGATIVEQVFSYEGLGMLYYRALGGTLVTAGLNPDTMPPPIGFPLDTQLVLTMTIMLVAVVAFSNMLADVLYAFADPRVDYSR